MLFAGNLNQVSAAKRDLDTALSEFLTLVLRLDFANVAVRSVFYTTSTSPKPRGGGEEIEEKALFSQVGKAVFGKLQSRHHLVAARGNQEEGALTLSGSPIAVSEARDAAAVLLSSYAIGKLERNHNEMLERARKLCLEKLDEEARGGGQEEDDHSSFVSSSDEDISHFRGERGSDSGGEEETPQGIIKSASSPELRTVVPTTLTADALAVLPQHKQKPPAMTNLPMPDGAPPPPPKTSFTLEELKDLLAPDKIFHCEQHHLLPQMRKAVLQTQNSVSCEWMKMSFAESAFVCGKSRKTLSKIALVSGCRMDVLPSDANDNCEVLELCGTGNERKRARKYVDMIKVRKTWR